MSQVIYLMFSKLLNFSMIVTCSCAPVSDQLNSQTVVKKTEEFFCASTKLQGIIIELILVSTYIVSSYSSYYTHM